MTHDWLLVETLGDEPAVVARGRELKKLVPITTFLRRSPYLAAVRTAIAETLQTGQSLTSITPKHDRVIRTEPVIMTDGRMLPLLVVNGLTVIRTARSLRGLRPRCRSDCVDESYAL